MEKPALTTKGQHTRQHILDTALHLFAERGYDQTTMRDIASAAGCSLGLTYRYFARKEDLVLALYQDLAGQSEVQIQNLPPGTLADRFHHIMTTKLDQVKPYRETIGGLFSAAMNPHSEAAVLGANTADIRERMTAVFKAAILGAKDAPKEQQAADMANLMYSLHLLMLLFWLYDHTPDQQATTDLLKFTRDIMTLARPFLMLPPAAKALTRLATILSAVFGGGHS